MDTRRPVRFPAELAVLPGRDNGVVGRLGRRDVSDLCGDMGRMVSRIVGDPTRSWSRNWEGLRAALCCRLREGVVGVDRNVRSIPNAPRRALATCVILRRRF